MSDTLDKDQLLRDIQAGWDRFQAYLATLTPEQMTGPTDYAGWTVKDHLMHLAVWEDGVQAALVRDNRAARMGVSEALLLSGDFDAINAVIQQQHRDRSLEDVQRHFSSVHARMVDTLAALDAEDLLKPYRHFQPQSTRDTPILEYVLGDTYEHYDEHQPWIAAIVGG